MRAWRFLIFNICTIPKKNYRLPKHSNFTIQKNFTSPKISKPTNRVSYQQRGHPISNTQSDKANIPLGIFQENKRNNTTQTHPKNKDNPRSSDKYNYYFDSGIRKNESFLMKPITPHTNTLAHTIFKFHL